jgi:putative hydrolase of the HAD superfamily
LISSSVKNIIFDLGGVIINIDYRLVLESFSRLSQKSPALILQQIKDTGILFKYDTGEYTDAMFRQAMNQILGASLTDSQVDEAWNAMLLDIPQDRIDLLLSLRKQYKLYLFSNTNNIHIQAVNHILKHSTGIEQLDNLFDKIYYSFLINHRKPAASSFAFVLQDSGLLPEETLFIDDRLDNIMGAKQLGILTVHIQAPITIVDIFN